MAWYKCSGGGEGIPLITKSGSIVTYEDSVGGVPINDLVADITPIQASGTPSPTNPLLISGYTEGVITVCGVNLWDEEWEMGSLTTNGADYASTTRIRCVGFVSVKSGTTYFLKSSGYTADVHYYDANQVHISWENKTDATFATPSNAKYIRFCMSVAYGTTYNNDISINYPSTDTSYHAYNGQTKSRSFGQTVYGGTWKASDGKVVSLLGTKSFDYTSDWKYEVTGGKKNFYVSMGNDFKAVQYSVTQGLCCNVALPSTINGYQQDKFFISSGKNFNWMCGDTLGLSSAQELKDYLQNNNLTVQVVAQLDTPTEITVEPVLLETIEGENNVFANTGDINVKFYKSSVSNLDTLVEQTKDLAPDLLALASAGDGSTTRVGFDLTEDTTWTKSTRIQNYMFYKNINVENINLPSILEVGEYAFEDAKYIKGINLPNCTSLKKEAFYNAAQKHTSTTLPSIAINLPAVTVVNDRSLSQIGYTGGLTATLILTACTEIKANGIRGMGSAYMRIAELLLPSLVTLGQESLNYNIFGTVDIGPNCTSIASKPFNYGTVETLIVRAITPPSLNANGLGTTPTRIKVPAGSLETYQTASNWSNYASIMEAI